MANTSEVVAVENGIVVHVNTERSWIMSNAREVIATADGYELVRYSPVGEYRIEHPASQTCSIWLTADEVAEITADPAIMLRWVTDGSMGTDTDNN